MPEGAARVISAVAGGILAIVGVAGIPLSYQAGSAGRFIAFTILFFAGIGILGWAYKD